MNIQYRIIKVDPECHGVLVRYFTDKVTEMDLASSFNEDGSVKLNADGYPLSARTDVMMSIYETPTPSRDEIEKRIMMNAPVDWLKLQEDIKNPKVNTKMTPLRHMVGDSKSFTLDELQEIRSAFLAKPEPVTGETSPDAELVKAYDIVVNLIDSLKVLAEKDPSVIDDFMELLKR